MRIILLLLLLGPVLGFGATRDFPIEVAYDCMTTEGDDLDLDDDGICELLTGIRFYDAESNGFITGGPATQTSFVIRYNDDWGRQCHRATVTMDDPMNPGQILESPYSNVGGCMDVVPGQPKAPVVR